MLNGVHLQRAFLAGFIGTAAMTVLMYAGPMMGMPKMDIATMLGTMFISDPKAAFWPGMLIHFLNGTIIFPLAYVWLLQPETGSGVGRGIGLGLILWVLAIAVVMPTMAFVHPMVRSGMMPAPGFLMLNMGIMAPIGSLIGHAVYGALLGWVAGPKLAVHHARTAGHPARFPLVPPQSARSWSPGSVLAYFTRSPGLQFARRIGKICLAHSH